MGGGTARVPDYFYMQKMFWVVIGSVIAFAALINLLDYILLWQRQRSLNAKPTSLLPLCYATLTALVREINSASLPTLHLRRWRISSPPLGKTLIVLAYLTAVCVFCFWGYDTESQWSWENIAYRCGCIAVAQLPLLFLLAGKQNLIGLATGTSYERLNWLHRWAARIMWLTSTFHMMFWFRSWARYNYIWRKISTDRLSQTGFAAYLVLTAVVVFSFLPIRRFSYELFVVSHLVLFAGAVGAIMLHAPLSRTYVWVAVALFFFDRLARVLVTLVANLSLFHRKTPGRNWLWANHATLTPLPGNVTRISIDKPVLKWSPGQHVFLSCHSVVPLQSHPFSIASLPSDQKLEFLVQARTGGTKRFHRFATRRNELSASHNSHMIQRKLVGVEGPYGTHRPLHQFDSVVFLAGGTGATFTVPLMRDLVQRWKNSQQGTWGIVTKRVRFVWVIKARDRLSWFQSQLEQALNDVESMRNVEGYSDIELNISIYMTCDEELQELNKNSSCMPEVHGEPEEETSASSLLRAERKAPSEEKIRVQAVESQGDEQENSGGGCCCKNTVDEDGAPMTCCCGPPPSSSDASSSLIDEKPTETDGATRPPGLKLVSGRPKPRSIIRKVLEEADGESAVVVCGPEGLQDDVRRSVVALSDERAVHKGTGAQGIYLHVEGFSY